jgi:hypothetical protein
VSPLVKYSVIRIGLFAAVLVILMLVGVPGWIAAIAAALVALSVSYIFFRRQRDDAITSIRKQPDTAARPASDEQAEDQ